MKTWNITICLSLSLLLACTSDQDTSLSGVIVSLEKAVEETSDKTKTQELISTYQKYIADNPTDAATNARYLYRMAGLYYRQNQHTAAAETLLKGLRQYPGSEVQSASLHLLGDLYSEHLNYRELGTPLYHHLLATDTGYAEADAVRKKAGKAPPNLVGYIDLLANDIYGDSVRLPDLHQARKYVTACEVNALVRPDDVRTPELLFKAANISRTTGRNPAKALDIYDWIYDRFSSYDKAYQALFLKAFTLDNEMKKIEEARTHYTAFLEKYPDDEFAVSAKFLLDNLGKSNDEIIKGFEKGGE